MISKFQFLHSSKTILIGSIILSLHNINFFSHFLSQYLFIHGFSASFSFVITVFYYCFGFSFVFCCDYLFSGGRSSCSIRWENPLVSKFDTFNFCFLGSNHFFLLLLLSFKVWVNFIIFLSILLLILILLVFFLRKFCLRFVLNLLYHLRILLIFILLLIFIIFDFFVTDFTFSRFGVSFTHFRLVLSCLSRSVMHLVD